MTVFVVGFHRLYHKSPLQSPPLSARLCSVSFPGLYNVTYQEIHVTYLDIRSHRNCCPAYIDKPPTLIYANRA
jgi:hypothetical protein